MRIRTFSAVVLLAATATLAAVGCTRNDGAPEAPAATPAETVRLLTRHLVDDDLDAFARAAVPPPVHAQLETAWREGRTRWPLDQLPFAEHLPRAMAALSAPDAERTLMQGFERQLANANLGPAAEFLTVFTVQYITQQGDFSVSEREHYPRLVQALGQWARTAPIGDRNRARAAIATMTAAAREADLSSDAAFAEAGMQDGLQRMSKVLAAGKTVLASYGLDLYADLRGMDVQLQSQTGDIARVRMRYTLAGTPIDAVVQLERREGRWYVSDFLRHAEDAVANAGDAGGVAPP
ncbi:MAG: hypothetical protein LCH70_10420 [Proteobacteria bacterium]|nr:hypothetical protein [Pseudomonadota bacterium]